MSIRLATVFSRRHEMLNIELDDKPRYTAIPDFFITKYLPTAPGDYVRVYIYIYMLAAGNEPAAPFSALGSLLGMDDKEVISALEYWEEKQLLTLFYTAGEITGVKILSNDSEISGSPCRLNRTQSKRALSDNEDAKTLCFVAEHYLGRPLKPREIETLLYFLIDLKFPLDLCDYLVEYCVSRGHKSISYIESVGLSWHKKGYKTLEDAQTKASNLAKRHFEVLGAFGIRGRNPIDKEIEFIDKWYDEYCFSFDIISEACGIAVMSTNSNRFQYADKILSGWHNAGVKTLDEARKSAKEFKSSRSSEKNTSSSSHKNKFSNFNQRDNDIDSIARQLSDQLMQKTENKNGAD